MLRRQTFSLPILACAALVVLCTISSRALPAPGQPIDVSTRCEDKASRDQDDMCIWVHPTDAALSTIITADKAANRLFVYDLEGKTLQAVELQHPGNIDLRYGFVLGKTKWDVVAVNLRAERKIAVLGVNPKTRLLERLDDGAIETRENYGGTLFRSPFNSKLYFITTSYGGHVEQFELLDNGQGKIRGERRRAWQLGLCEGAVADDETGSIYVSQEQKGVWEVSGELEDKTPPKLAIKLGENGLTGDVEGLAIYHLPKQAGYLLVSNQGSNNFKVYERSKGHAYVGTFAIRGAQDTDGLDVANVQLGDRFPSGLLACHTGSGHCPVLLVRWESIAASFAKPLTVSTEWNPR